MNVTRSQRTGRGAPPDEIEVSVVAAAIYKVHLEAARGALNSLVLPIERIAETLVEVRDCSDDRASVITLFALVDDLMITLIKRNLNSNLKGGLERLFESHGLLATASSRLTMASALFWLRAETYSELDLLRKIRNKFAHSVRIKNLTDEPVSGWLSSMTASEKAMSAQFDAARHHNPELEARDMGKYTDRQRLVFRGAWLVHHVCMELPVRPIALLH